MTRFQVDSDEVLNASSTVRATIGRIQSEVASLHGQLVNLQSTWAGTAATAFQGAASSWHATEQRVSDDLAALNQALAHAGQTYAETEAVNTRLFAR
jgi:WXG100 family type VII secretion target